MCLQEWPCAGDDGDIEAEEDAAEGGCNDGGNEEVWSWLQTFS